MKMCVINYYFIVIIDNNIIIIKQSTKKKYCVEEIINVPAPCTRNHNNFLNYYNELFKIQIHRVLNTSSIII